MMTWSAQTTTSTAARWSRLRFLGWWYWQRRCRGQLRRPRRRPGPARSHPAKAHAVNQVAGARANLSAAHADLAQALDTAAAKTGRRGNGGTATLDPAAGQALHAAQLDLATAKKSSRATDTHLPRRQVRPVSRLLETERKQTAAPKPLNSTNEDLGRRSARIPHGENRHIRLEPGTVGHASACPTRGMSTSSR